MTYRYAISIRIPMRSLSSAVKGLEDSLNETMAGFGFTEKTFITSILPLELTLQRLPTLEETAQLQEILIAQCTESFGYAKIEEWTLVSASETTEPTIRSELFG